MATPLSSTWFVTPCSTIVYPSTVNPCLLLKPLNHQKLYSRKSPNFSVSLRPENKFHKHGHIPVIINKIEADPDAQEEEDDLGVKAALSMLKFYKREISPLLPKSCRYVPTCSEYSMIAYKRYGVVKGTVLTAWRLCRCNPLGGSGFDPPRWFGEVRPPEDVDVWHCLLRKYAVFWKWLIKTSRLLLFLGLEMEELDFWNLCSTAYIFYKLKLVVIRLGTSKRSLGGMWSLTVKKWGS